MPNKIPEVALLLKRNWDAVIFVLDKLVELIFELTVKLPIVAVVNRAVAELIFVTVFVIKVPTDKLVNTPLVANIELVLICEVANNDVVVIFVKILLGIVLETADKEPFTSKV